MSTIPACTRFVTSATHWYAPSSKSFAAFASTASTSPKYSTNFLADSAGGRAARCTGFASYQPMYFWYTAFALCDTVP